MLVCSKIQARIQNPNEFAKANMFSSLAPPRFYENAGIRQCKIEYIAVNGVCSKDKYRSE
jgi:hypothetical protein